MTRISLLHASRQRPQIAFDCFNEWIQNASSPEQIQYILGLDDDDPTINEYIELFAHPSEEYKLIMNFTDSRNVVQAFNNAAKLISSTTELIITVSDDMGCFKNWDMELFKLLEGVNNFEEPRFIGVSDGVRTYGIVLVYYIANIAYYKKFGYILYPEYDGVFADSDMHQVAHKSGYLIHAPQLTFQHKHWSLGLSKKDEISMKNDATTNPAGWKRNHKIYQMRAKRNFDL